MTLHHVPASVPVSPPRHSVPKQKGSQVYPKGKITHSRDRGLRSSWAHWLQDVTLV